MEIPKDWQLTEGPTVSEVWQALRGRRMEIRTQMPTVELRSETSSEKDPIRNDDDIRS